MTETNKEKLGNTPSARFQTGEKNSRRIRRVAVLMVALIILITALPGCSGQERAGSTGANAGIQSESDTAVAASGNVTADGTGDGSPGSGNASDGSETGSPESGY